jgi:hypothetical protein
MLYSARSHHDEKRRRKMKYWILLIIFIALCTGATLADTGIKPVPEIQGLTTHTVIMANGSFSHASDLAIEITDDLNGLNGIPPLGDSSEEGSIDVISYQPLVEIAQAQNMGATYYESVYSEDTGSNGMGSIGYTKDLDATTGAVLAGQSNIAATKQIMYTGEPGSEVLSNDFISVMGASNPSPSARFGLGLNTEAPAPGALSSDKFICPFSAGSISPAFCNSVQANSAIGMSVADVTTTTSARFIMASADPGVALSHNIQVSDSIGAASAGIDVSIKESRPAEDLFPFEVTMLDPNTGQEYTYTGWVGISSTKTYEESTMHDFTSIDGLISTYAKTMSYTSTSV